MNQQYSTYSRSLLPALKQNGLEVVVSHEDLTKEQGAFVDRYFEENVYPVLTPMAVASSRPVRWTWNKSLDIGALIAKKTTPRKNWISATVQVPSVLPRLVHLPDGKRRREAGHPSGGRSSSGTSASCSSITM